MSDTVSGAFFDHFRSKVDPGASIFSADGWLANVGLFTADGGFDDASWVRAAPETTIGFLLNGSAIRCETNTNRGTVSGPGRRSALIARGTSNASLCDETARFAHIYLPDQLVDRAAEQLGARR